MVTKRPRDSSLDVRKAEQTLAIKPLEVQEAFERMKKDEVRFSSFT
jgi:dTDP-4-dehydrorhamnose reductase